MANLEQWDTTREIYGREMHIETAKGEIKTVKNMKKCVYNTGYYE